MDNNSMNFSKKVLKVFSLFIFLVACSKKNDEIVLVTTSDFGSLVHLATFDGNSSSKASDCNFTAVALNEKYGNKYRCETWGNIKKSLK
jgi:hypothetical protein